MRENGIVITIDGPSGAGKSSAGKILAERIGYNYIDTGAMYRAVAYYLYKMGINIEDEAEVEKFMEDVEVDFIKKGKDTRVICNGEDVTDRIRDPEIDMLTSKVSGFKKVRFILTQMQRRLSEKGGVVLEGRDTGTEVIPDAEVKFYLDATLEERGRRRWLQLREKGMIVERKVVEEEVMKRDTYDSTRKIAPLRAPSDSVRIDSTSMSIDDVVELMLQYIKPYLALPKGE